MAKQNNMYKLAIDQFPVHTGCEHDCYYCGSSFQAQLKRYGKNNCQFCYEFVPHGHPERLDENLLKTQYMQFIFVASSGDIAFCPTDYLKQIVARIRKDSDKNFLIQSKDPSTFNRVKFPSNVILGTTIETNRDTLYSGISKAPSPSQRFKDFAEVDHPLKMITIEPVIVFDLDTMVSWMKEIKPCMIWLGYDSKKNNLPEPELKKVRELHWELSRAGFVVILKTIREAR